MASLEYARRILKLAGEQIANRTTVVVRKRAAGSPHLPPKAQDAVNRQRGAITLPSHVYTGPSDRHTEDDPHQAAYAVCQVERLLGMAPDLRPVFGKCYVQGEHPGNMRREESALAKMLADQLGKTVEDYTVPGASIKEWRLSRLETERLRQADRQRRIRQHRKAIAQANESIGFPSADDRAYTHFIAACVAITRLRLNLPGSRAMASGV